MRRATLATLALVAWAARAEAQRVFVSPAEARRLIEQEGAVVLEVGRPRDAEHLPHARPVLLAEFVETRDGIPNELPPVAQLERTLELEGVNDARPVLVYGDPLGAARLWLTLDVLGHPRAYLLDGGLARWKAEGFPLEGPSDVHVTPRGGSFTPALRTERLIAADELAAKHRDPSFLVVDARSPGEYAGTQQTPQVPRPGHIPGARSVFWRRFLQSDSVTTLRDRAELRQLLSLPAGATTLVAYCRTGHMASMLYAVARELDLPVRLYDPSFVEWSGRGDLPVEQGPPGSTSR